MEEQLLERWIIPRLMDDHVTTENIEVRIYGDEDGHIISVHLKTMNGLKHFGVKVPQGVEDALR